MKAEEIRITTADGKPLCTKQDASELLGVGTSSIDRYIKEGTLTPIPNRLNRIFFTKDDIRKAALFLGKAAYFLERITV